MRDTEAKAKNLPGGDVYVRSHLAYKDPVNRGAMIMELCRESAQAFLSTTTMTAHEARRAEGQAAIKWFEGGMVGKAPPSPYQFHRLHFLNIENLLIGTGFELALKARLIGDGYVVHVIRNKEPFKALANRQRTEPVLFADLLAIEGYIYEPKPDGKSMNHLQGLTKNSLNFDKILNEPGYRSVLALNDLTMEVIDYYREARNNIHLPGDVWNAAESLRGVDLTPIIIDFVNNEVIDVFNRQVADRGLPVEIRMNPLR